MVHFFRFLKKVKKRSFFLKLCQILQQVAGGFRIFILFYLYKLFQNWNFSRKSRRNLAKFDPPGYPLRIFNFPYVIDVFFLWKIIGEFWIMHFENTSLPNLQILGSVRFNFWFFSFIFSKSPNFKNFKFQFFQILKF